MTLPSKLTLLEFLAIFILAFFLFSPSLNYYFFQDDWFVLNWVSNSSLSSFLEFRTDIIYWRPISMPLLFALAKALFGLNPFLFHALAFLLFLALIIAIYQLFKLLTSNHKLAITAAFLYALWPIHYISLSWFSTTAYILGPLFQVLAFIFFIKYSLVKRSVFYLAALGFFLLATASSEFALVLPLIFLAWALLSKKKISPKIFAPFLVVDLIYLLLRLVIFPIPATGTYQPHLDLQIITNFIWYLAWALGLPESFKFLIFPSLPNQSIKIITQFWSITLPFFLITVFLVGVITKTFKKNFKLYLFALAWLIIGIAPVITVINHSYPMYLSFAGLGFLFLILMAFKNSKNLTLLVFLSLWTIISFRTLQFTRSTHWIGNEQAISKAYVSYVTKKYQNPKQNSVFIFRPADKDFSQAHKFYLSATEDNLSQALNGDTAMQVIFADQTLKSVYKEGDESFTFPSGIDIIEISPSLDR